MVPARSVRRTRSGTSPPRRDDTDDRSAPTAQPSYRSGVTIVNPRRDRMRTVGLTVIVLAAMAMAAACGDGSASPTLGDDDAVVGQQLPTESMIGSYVGDVALPDASTGRTPYPLVAEPGDVLLVYFGYTACPDVCPTTLSDLRAALRDLGDDASRVDVAMVTIDPERDLDAGFSAYLSSFIPEGHALRANNDAELRTAADAFDATYSVVHTGDDVEVEHSAYVYAVNDAGEIVAVWSFGAEPADIAADLGRLLSEA